MEHDNVNHPKHYMEGFDPVNIECIDITRYMGFRSGNAFKYVWRAGKKGGEEKAAEDLRKALWYLYDVQRTPGLAEHISEGAIAVFHLLSGENNLRYRALSSIVHGAYHVASDYVEEMLEGEEGCPHDYRS